MPVTKRPAWKIGLATTPEQIGRCSSVMRELRPHIEAIEFAARVLRQQKEGYQLAYLELEGAVRSVADPDVMVEAFLQSTYEAAAELAGWDRATLEARP